MLKNGLLMLTLTLCIIYPYSAFAVERLIFAVDIVRHGDRNPGSDLPKSPYSWKGGLGDITQDGIDREYRLGQTLREEYVKKYSFLSAQYQPNTMLVRSTDTTRTIESAKALLNGLYPLEFRNTLEIPIRVVPRDKDDLLLVKPENNIFSIIKMYFWKRKIWKEMTNGMKDELDRWGDLTGLELKNMDDINTLADNIFIRQQRKIPFPIGIDFKSAEKIISLDETFITSMFKQNEISAPTGKRIISTIKYYMESNLQKMSPIKYVLFSGHDATIMSVLSTLNADFKIPIFASRLSFQLFQIEERFEVRVTQDDLPVFIPNCQSNTCNLSQIFKVLVE